MVPEGLRVKSTQIITRYVRFLGIEMKVLRVDSLHLRTWTLRAVGSIPGKLMETGPGVLDKRVHVTVY